MYFFCFCNFRFENTSYIFVFWFLVDLDIYQKTKISAIKFVYFFFNSSKPVLTQKYFVDRPIRYLFSQQKINVKKIDSCYFGHFVAIYQKSKDENMRWTGELWSKIYFFENYYTKRDSTKPIISIFYIKDVSKKVDWVTQYIFYAGSEYKVKIREIKFFKV